MKIHNHKVDTAVSAPSPNHGGRINPKFIVMHYTAGWTASSAINTFRRRSSRVSAHITVDQNGSVYQHVPFNVRAWHAGPSKHAGYSGLNGHSIGIEIVNPGYLKKVGDGYMDSTGNVVSAAKAEPVLKQAHSRVGSGDFYWPLYTEAALDSVEEITELLITRYGIKDIVSHEEIDLRGWKTDPGPAFPMNRFKKLLNTRADDVDFYEVTASSLNVRSGPSTRYGVINKLTRGQTVGMLDKQGSWVKIDDDGWVHGSYLRRA